MGSRRAVLLIVLVTAGCSLGSFTGYSSGGVDPNDAGSTDATTIDADAGGSAGDARADADAATDGCTSIFCDDFEKNAAIGVGYDVAITGGGTIEKASAPAPVHSGSRSARVVVSSGSSARAFLVRNFSTTTKHATFSFWMNMPQPARLLQFARVELVGADGKSGNYVLQWQADGTLLGAEQYYDGADYVNFVPHDLSGFVPDVWQPWTLDIDATGAPARVKVFVDGTLVTDESLQNPFAPGVVRAYFGATFLDDGPAITYYFDDIAVDFAP